MGRCRFNDVFSEVILEFSQQNDPQINTVNPSESRPAFTQLTHSPGSDLGQRRSESAHSASTCSESRCVCGDLSGSAADFRTSNTERKINKLRFINISSSEFEAAQNKSEKFKCVKLERHLQLQVTSCHAAAHRLQKLLLLTVSER